MLFRSYNMTVWLWVYSRYASMSVFRSARALSRHGPWTATSTFAPIEWSMIVPGAGVGTQLGPPLSFSETTGGGARAASLTPPPFGRAAPPGKQHAPDPRACRQVCAMLNPLPQYPPTRSWPCVPPHSAFPISVRHQKYASRCLTQQQGCPLVSVGVG